MFDVIIIGSGIIGSSIARELSRYELNCMVLEKENDVSCGTTKANSGIVHAGFDAIPGTLKARFNVDGNKMFETLSKELDFPYRKNEAMVLSFSEDGHKTLEELLDRARRNNVLGCSIISGDEARKLEKNLSSDVCEALLATESGIVSPYEMCIAMAENACSNGVIFKFEEKVISLENHDTFMKVITDKDTYQAKVVVNAAGLYSDVLNNIVSSKKYHITPRIGEYVLLDKGFMQYANRTLFQLPTVMGKGILVSPTTHGNLIVGPTAKNVSDKDSTDTTPEGLAEAQEKAKLSVPNLPLYGVITQFSGIRAHEDSDDFVIGFAPDCKCLFNCLGIESPGLASSPAISLYAANEISEKLGLKPNPNFNPIRKGFMKVSRMKSEEADQLIKSNPLYGHIVCRCEVVSEGEIVDAIKRRPGAVDLDGIKRRTRAGMGRCQMGFCTTKILEILSRETGKKLSELTKKGHHSNVVVGGVKDVSE